MKNIKLLLFVIFFSKSINAQTNLGNTFSGSGNPATLLCPQTRAAFTDEKVNQLIVEILNVSNLKNRFIIMPCSGISNCQAIYYEGKPYILYNAAFLNEIKGLSFSEKDLIVSERNWESITILAHELGHHFNNHLNNPPPGATAQELELEADEFAGSTIYMLGGSLIQAQSAFKNESVSESYTHPGRLARLAAVAKGWNDAEAKFPRIRPNPINPTPRKTNYTSISQLDMVEPFPLSPPAFTGNSAPTSRQAEFTLTLLSKKSNDIIDGEKWFNVNSLKLPEHKSDFSNIYNFQLIGIPSGIPINWKNLKLCKGIIGQNERIYLYGKDFSSAKILLITDESSSEIHHFLDFSSFNHAPNTKSTSAEFDFVFQSIRWATVVDNVLYVSHSAGGYAYQTKGMNGYISAIDLSDNHILWTSKPLVNNAGNFEIVNNSIICGYGFTEEPDFLYVLDRSNGRQQSKISLDSGPDYIIRKDKVLYVRTYNKDYQFLINFKAKK